MKASGVRVLGEFEGIGFEFGMLGLVWVKVGSTASVHVPPRDPADRRLQNGVSTMSTSLQMKKRERPQKPR